MITSLALVTCLLIGQVEDSTAKKSAGAELKQRVSRLVRQLDADEGETRKAAAEALIALGPGVLDHLPTITNRMSSEQVLQLGIVRKTLETRAAEAASRASLVTLKGKMSLADALAELEKQTGNQFAGNENQGGSVTVDFEKTPFWQVLDDVLDQSGLTINPYGGHGDRLKLEARPDEELPRSGSADYQGVFRFEGLRLISTRDLRNPLMNVLRLTLQVAWEPRSRPISLEFPLDQIELIDENDNPLPVNSSRARLAVEVQPDIPSSELILPIGLPDRGVKRIKRFKGKMLATIPGRDETFEFANVDSTTNVEKRRAGVAVTFEKLSKNVDLYELRVNIKFDKAANALESHRGWIYRNEAYLLRADGERLDYLTFETTRQDADQVGLAYLFDLEKGPKGCKFVYKTPAAILKMTFPYELTGLDLP